MIKYPESKKRHLECSRSYRSVYFALLMLAFQSVVTLYINSTYLEQFVAPESVGVLFMAGAALSIVSLLTAAKLLRRYGNRSYALGLILLNALTLLGMGLVEHRFAVVPLFIIHQALSPLLFFSLDIFLESLSGTEEKRTGSRRGFILSMLSFASAVAPLAAGFLMGNGAHPNFAAVYITSAVLLLPIAAFFYYNFRSFKDASYTDVKLVPALRSFWRDLNLRYVFCAHFLLQLFFAWMVIYIPLYLATELGFSWDAIGAILFVGLLAYVFLEYPVGLIADRYLGEQEMMAAGFMILGVSTAWLSLIATAAIIPWMVALFMTRVGAALVESTTESYFFKHARGEDVNVIGFFRISRPLAILFGALLGSAALFLLPFQFIFAALGFLLLSGIIFATLIEDTR
jgi:predicted MFS family arabinose efflux permease